ncbi:hypothetical protein DFQ27_001827 [Actinomortierella ambigua]|uniref:Proteasome inhibitor PI31 subunit n=1 Tax=Actinomortierella ambigua TaxID=1343610 RepID=A0A9P6Q920_9FUNG|nr:hypothetical protein DFQ27_001827 [Actinomortierella ambigua]
MSSSSPSASNAPEGMQESMPSTLLDCDSVIALLHRLLPSDTRPASSSTESPSSSVEAELAQEPTVLLSSPYAALAALVHAMMTTVGFRLVGLSEDDKLEGDRQSTDPSVSNLLPQHWSASKESFSFRYTHGHSQLNYLIKCVRLANKLVIHGTTLETNKICSLELDVQGFTSPSYFPFTTATDLSRDPLWNGFISRSRINDLIRDFKINVVQQLIPGLSKPGYVEERTAATSSSTGPSTNTTTGSSSDHQQRDRDRQRFYPDEDDPLRIPGRSSGIPRPPLFGEPFSPEDFNPHHNPFSIGRHDLDPLAGGGLYGGGIGGGLGGIGGSSGGGMIVGPDHPMFRRPPGGSGPFGGGIGGGGLYGGPQPLPRGSVPPGARFDPIGPFNPVGGNAPGAGTAHGPPPQGAGRGRGRQFPGEPDNDELPPPGYMDMFM